MEPPRHLLIRGVNWLGDAVMTTPALARLRERFPSTHIALLTRSKLASLWQGHPSVNEVIEIPDSAGVWSVAAKLRAWRPPDAQGSRSGFQLAIILPNSPRSALECRLARIPERVGYSRPWRNWMLTRAIDPRPGHQPMRKRSIGEIRELVAGPAPSSPTAAAPNAKAHQIHEYLYLAAALGADPTPVPLRLEVSAAEVESARKKVLSSLTISSRKAVSGSRIFVGLNPGAEYGPAKRWPAERFAAVACEISKQVPDCTWLLFGSPADRGVCEQIASSIGGDVQNLAGATSLRELMALLKLCRALLTNDTGPMHVAAALGVPAVVPFGSTSPELTGPISAPGLQHQVISAAAPCSPCFLRTCPIDFRCMTGITVERVIDTLLGLVVNR
jgi:heptosyltransferase-2